MAAPAITTLLTPNPASGNTTTDGTVQTLASATAAAGVYQLSFNCANMVDGDRIRLKGAKKTYGSDTRTTVVEMTIEDGGKGIVELGPVSTSGDVLFTVERLAGTDRAYRWGVLNFTGA